jgi:uncharacterized membrane protein YczE
MEKGKPKKNNQTRVSLILRMAVSVYLLYLAWELKGAPFSHTGVERVVFAAAVLIFTVVAVILGGFSLRAYLRGEYDLPDEGEDSEK